MAPAFSLMGIDHVAIAVFDVRRSVEWYCAVLGLERRYEDVWGDCPAIVGAGTTALALFPAKPGVAFPGQGGMPGMRHIAFAADAFNFEAAKQELTDRSIEFHFEDHQIAHSIYFKDPDGYEIEITTYDI